jgi:hypothetical protein
MKSLSFANKLVGFNIRSKFQYQIQRNLAFSAPQARSNSAPIKAKLSRMALKETRRINHALENSPDIASLEILDSIIKKRHFQVDTNAGEEKIILTRTTDLETITVTYYTWSNYESIGRTEEDDPILFEFFTVSLEKADESDALFFKCLYDPFTLVDAALLPKGSNYYDTGRYQGRSMDQIPLAVKVNLTVSGYVAMTLSNALANL